MSSRHVVIGPYQAGALSAFSDIANLEPVLKLLPPLPVARLVYATLVQAGATRIEIAESEDPKSREVPEKWRGKPLDKAVYREIAGNVESAFAPHLPAGYQKNPKYSDVWSIESYLIDLLYALKQKRALVLLTAPPTAAECEAALPPILGVPIANLIRSVQVVDAELPYLKSFIERDSIDRFQDLIDGGMFAEYVGEHVAAEDQNRPAHSAVTAIVQKGQKIVNAAQGLVSLRKVGLGILPLTAKIVDTVFGKIPGELAEYGSNILTGRMKDGQRLITYNLDGLSQKLILDRIISFARESQANTEEADSAVSELAAKDRDDDPNAG